MTDYIKPTDDKFGKFQRKMLELTHKVDQGALELDWVMGILDQVIEGRLCIGESNIIHLNPFQPFDPVMFIGAGCRFADKDLGDHRSSILSEIDLAQVCFKTTAIEDEVVCITREERRERLKASGNICLGHKVFQTLWENKGFIPEKWKYFSNICFDGTVFCDSEGERFVLSLYWNGNFWAQGFNFLKDDCDMFEISAVLSSPYNIGYNQKIFF